MPTFQARHKSRDRLRQYLQARARRKTGNPASARSGGARARHPAACIDFAATPRVRLYGATTTPEGITPLSLAVARRGGQSLVAIYHPDDHQVIFLATVDFCLGPPCTTDHVAAGVELLERLRGVQAAGLRLHVFATGGWTKATGF